MLKITAWIDCFSPNLGHLPMVHAVYDFFTIIFLLNRSVIQKDYKNDS